jgi:hypothetical protein
MILVKGVLGLKSQKWMISGLGLDAKTKYKWKNKCLDDGKIGFNISSIVKVSQGPILTHFPIYFFVL